MEIDFLNSKTGWLNTAVAVVALVCGMVGQSHASLKKTFIPVPQDDSAPVLNSAVEDRIVRLQGELTKQLRVLGSRHPSVLELRSELQILKRYVGQPIGPVKEKVMELEIELAKLQLEFSGSHPKVKSIRKQIYQWQDFASQERVGSADLISLDTEIKALQIELLDLQDSNLAAGHPAIKKLKKELLDLQWERNTLGLQEECERQNVYIWASEIEKVISAEAQKQGLSSEDWLNQKTKAYGLSADEFRTQIVWQQLALRKLADLKKPLRDRQLQRAVDSFRKLQLSTRPDQ